jgi:hypothetical protein
MLFSELGNRIYTEDEYVQLYGDYLKSGGSPYQKDLIKRI